MVSNRTKILVGACANLQAQVIEHKKTKTFKLYKSNLKARLTRINTALKKFIRYQKNRGMKVDDIGKLSRRVRKKIILSSRKAKFYSEIIRKKRKIEVKIVEEYTDELPEDFLIFISTIPAYEHMFKEAIEKSKDLDKKSKKWLSQVINHFEYYGDIITNEILI